MANIENPRSTSSNIILDEEIDRIIFLCSHIAQMASNIRLVHLSNISLTVESIELCYQSLLLMAENIEGSALLLESLLAIQQRYLIKKPTTRICYTREELLQLQKRVTPSLYNEVGNLLRQVVERESNDSVEIQRKSWRDIRTILM